MTTAFLQENAASRRRLETLVRRLTDDDLARTTPYGWTVAALLAHLAFWDQRVLVLLRRWQEHGVDSSPIDAQAVNDALRPVCLALEPRKAIELCLASAAAVDAEIETITPELIQQIEDQVRTSPFQLRFNRALHRDDHLNHIEQLLQGSRDSSDILT